MNDPIMPIIIVAAVTIIITIIVVVLVIAAYLFLELCQYFYLDFDY